MKTHKKFTPRERELLAHLLALGYTHSACALKLVRPRRSIIREMKRNSVWVMDRSGQRVQVYIPITAQARADRRQYHSAHNKQPLKNADVYHYVTEHLRTGWSPEQISGRLRTIDHPDDPHWQICHETIYAWIYRQPGTDEGNSWIEYLRRKQKKRQKQNGRTVHRGHIPDRVSISKRPEAANNRTEFGHWEGDTLEGKRGLNSCGLHTEAERMSRRTLAAKVLAITSEEALSAQVRLFEKEPAAAVKSTTLDNGRETHKHYVLRSRLNMMTYHAHPYAAYERGTNEHANWHLRYYFPKGTDFSTVSEPELQAVVEEINSRPRKILGFKTANEVYDQLLEKELRCDDRS